MLDKNLIQKNFEKSLKTYNANAFIQKKSAIKLISLLKRKNFKKILEIGSFTGFLTQAAVKNLDFESYLAIDIVESFDFIKNLNSKISFQKIDVENFETNQKFDLIISNASLQWCNDFFETIQKLKSYLAPDGILALCIFGEKNLFEIKNTFQIGLEYHCLDKIKKHFSKNAQIFEDIEILKFDSSVEILKHLKMTGVNSVSKNHLKISEIKKNLKILNDKFENKLTYNPLYIID